MNTDIAIIPIEGALEIFQQAPLVLKRNQESSAKALAAGSALLNTIQAEGMSDALDDACNGYLVKLKKSLVLMNDRRKPITQIMDEFKKYFTSEEAKIDTKGEIYTAIQNFRNKYAEKKANDAAEQRRLIEIKAKKDQALVILKADIEANIIKCFDVYANESKTKLSTNFEKVTLENYEKALEYFSKPVTAPPMSTLELRIDEGKYSMGNISLNEYSELRKQIFTGAVYVNHATSFDLQLDEYRVSLLDKLPSKKAQLEEIAEAEKNNAEEAARLKEQQAQHAAAEQARLKEENDKKEHEAATLAEANKQSAITTSLFEASAEMAEVMPEARPVRESYNIEVVKPAGWFLIVSFYFEKEGNGKTQAELEKKTLLQMKTFCEKWAVKSDTKIESPLLKYTETFKAIATKK